VLDQYSPDWPFKTPFNNFKKQAHKMNTTITTKIKHYSEISKLYMVISEEIGIIGIAHKEKPQSISELRLSGFYLDS
jgi:hypothetical protein